MTLLPPLCACAVCLVIGKGNQAYSDSPLENPACIDQYKQPSATIRELSGLLKDMRLKSFYNGARKHTLTFSLATRDNIDTELKEKIWNYYLVASAPLFTYKTYREIAHPETVQKRAGAQSLPEGCPGKSRPSPFRQGKGIPEA